MLAGVAAATLSVPAFGEDKMRFIPGLAILAFAAASPIAAQEQCSVGTLNGQYVFTGRGFIEAVEPGVQRVHFF